MRTFAIAAIAGAAAETAQYARYEAAFAPAMVARDDCAELPKLCTDGVMLSGGLTTLTYLCPDKTAVPSTVTVTTTATTTVTEDLPNTTSWSVVTTVTEDPDSTSWSVGTTVFDIGPTSLNEGASTSGKRTTSDEPTTTMTILSTANVTVTRVVTRVSGSLSPTITGASTAVLHSGPGETLTADPTTSSVTEVLPSIPSIDISDIFPSHTVTTNSSSAAYSPPSVTSSANVTSSSSAAYSAPLYSNSTSSSSSTFLAPTFIIGREAKPAETGNSTQSVTSTAPAAMASKGMAGESRVSFAALFLGLMAAARIV